MLRSMYAGISGMKNFQTKLDVIGNNIANVSTAGFKKGRVTFQEMMSQTTAGAQGPSATRGGMNAAQVGLGSQLGTIDNIHTQGFRQTTNNPLDLSIQGDGMFEVILADDVIARHPVGTVVNGVDVGGEVINGPFHSLITTTNGVTTTADHESYYTRAGNFYLDNEGFIVNSEGMYLVGFSVANNIGDINNPGIIQIPLDAQSFNISTNGMVNYVDADGENQVAGQVALANFSNASGLLKDGSNLYRSSQNSGDPVRTSTEAGIVSNSLEMSNVDLAEEFTEMITAQRGFQANTRIITTSDEILQELVNLKR